MHKQSGPNDFVNVLAAATGINPMQGAPLKIAIFINGICIKKTNEVLKSISNQRTIDSLIIHIVSEDTESVDQNRWDFNHQVHQVRFSNLHAALNETAKETDVIILHLNDTPFFPAYLLRVREIIMSKAPVCLVYAPPDPNWPSKTPFSVANYARSYNEKDIPNLFQGPNAVFPSALIDAADGFDVEFWRNPDNSLFLERLLNLGTYFIPLLFPSFKPSQQLPNCFRREDAVPKGEKQDDTKKTPSVITLEISEENHETQAARTRSPSTVFRENRYYGSLPEFLSDETIRSISEAKFIVFVRRGATLDNNRIKFSLDTLQRSESVSICFFSSEMSAFRKAGVNGELSAGTIKSDIKIVDGIVVRARDFFRLNTTHRGSQKTAIVELLGAFSQIGRALFVGPAEYYGVESQKKISAPKSKNKKTLFFWPNYTEANPYQKLLYAKRADDTRVLSGTIDEAESNLRARGEREIVIFHIHWLNSLFRDVIDAKVARRRVTEFIARLNRFKASGGKIVFTVHNEISHEAPFSVDEISLSRAIVELSDVVHLHEWNSRSEVMAFEIPPEKIVIVPHGHYVGEYKNTLNRHEAREILGFNEEDEVILFSGLIRKYKGVATLIECFRLLLRERKNLKLLLIGSIVEDPFSELSEPLSASELDSITLSRRFVDDDELQVYFNAADVAVYPYEKILTSGSVLLSLSFGVPVVAPRVAMVEKLISHPSYGALVNDAKDVGEIAGAVAEVLDARNNGISFSGNKDFRQFVSTWKWKDFFDAISPWLNRVSSSGRHSGVQEVVMAAETRERSYSFLDKQKELLRNEPSFNRNWVEQRYPRIVSSFRSTEEAFLTDGSFLTKPNENFCLQKYRRLRPDSEVSIFHPFIHSALVGSAWREKSAPSEFNPDRHIDEREKVVLPYPLDHVVVLLLAEDFDFDELPGEWETRLTSYGFHLVTKAMGSVLDESHSRRMNTLQGAIRSILEDEEVTALGKGVYSFFVLDKSIKNNFSNVEGRLFSTVLERGPKLRIDAGDRESGHILTGQFELLLSAVPSYVSLEPSGWLNHIAIRARFLCPDVVIDGSWRHDPLLGAPLAALPALEENAICNFLCGADSTLENDRQWPLRALSKEALGFDQNIENEQLPTTTRSLFDVFDTLGDVAKTKESRGSNLFFAQIARGRIVDKWDSSSDFKEFFEVTSNKMGPRWERSSEITLFACVKDDHQFIQPFLRHYRRLGVSRFVLVDDYSKQPLEKTLEDDDVLIVRPKVGRFLSAKVLWIGGLIKTFCEEGSWVVTVDADEFLDFPSSVNGFSDLRENLEAHGIDFFPAVLLDMLPSFDSSGQSKIGRLSGFVDYLSHVAWMDRDMPQVYADQQVIRWGFGRHARIQWKFDARFHLFGTFDSMRKIPFHKTSSSRHLNQGFHSLQDENARSVLTTEEWLFPLCGYLRHYKFAKILSADFRNRDKRDFSGYFEDTAENLARMSNYSSEKISDLAAQLSTVEYSVERLDEFFRRYRSTTNDGVRRY